MEKRYDVVIIGAGTAGLSARREVANKTDNYLVIDDGPLGTTCARVGCMPSKVLIQVANDFHRRHKFSELGISGEEHLSIDHKAVMNHVRGLRDRFVRSVNSGMETWIETHLKRKRAKFVDRETLDLEGEIIKADKIIIATGSRPIVPGPWQEYKDYIVNTDEFFEMEELPKKVAVIGLGVIGIELGQALSRLGIEVIGITVGKEIGGVTDPKLQDYIASKMEEEFEIAYDGAEIIGPVDGGIKVKSGEKEWVVEKLFLTMGRKANIDKVDIENLDVPLNDRGMPEFSATTFKIKDTNVFIAGDVTSERPLLHEAADEGRIVGHNAVAKNTQCYKRRTPLGITFSSPNIATIGKRYRELKNDKIDFVTGEVSYEGQGRAIVKLQEKGRLHIFADKADGKILGAELFAPSGEHMAHLLAWSLTLNLTVKEALAMPFYHPVLEEGLRTALRDAQNKLKEADENDENLIELFRCQDPPIR